MCKPVVAPFLGGRPGVGGLSLHPEPSPVFVDPVSDIIAPPGIVPVTDIQKRESSRGLTHIGLDPKKTSLVLLVKFCRLMRYSAGRYVYSEMAPLRYKNRAPLKSVTALSFLTIRPLVEKMAATHRLLFEKMTATHPQSRRKQYIRVPEAREAFGRSRFLQLFLY